MRYFRRVQRGAAIILVGFMGSGKSAVGRNLATKTGRQFRDTDEMVVAQAGMPVADIFARRGEEIFRDLEADALMELPNGRVIIATGGGIILRAENSERLRQLGTVFYLHAAEGILYERAARSGKRPLLKTENPRATFHDLLVKRAPLYRAVADFEIDTSGRRSHEIADEILARIDA